MAVYKRYEQSQISLQEMLNKDSLKELCQAVSIFQHQERLVMTKMIGEVGHTV